MTTKEAATLAGLSIQRVQRFAKENPDLVKKIGRDYNFTPEALQVLQERKGKVGQPRNPEARYSRFKNN